MFQYRDFAMYKKFMLSLMFFSIFSSRESLCIEPISTCIIIAIACNTAASLITYTINKIDSLLDSSPEKKEARERSDLIDARTKFRKCIANSKRESEKTRSGIPVKCKDLANTFLACGGKEEIIKIIVDFEELGS